MANIIDPRIIDYYKSLYRRGDAGLIAEEAGVQAGTIHVALCTGRCSVRLAREIEAFYDKRAQELEKTLLTATDYDE
jgi:hypothetical protein